MRFARFPAQGDIPRGYGQRKGKVNLDVMPPWPFVVSAKWAGSPWLPPGVAER